MERTRIEDRFEKAQSFNAQLSGAVLIDVVQAVVRIATNHRAWMVATDAYAERIIGTALALRPTECQAADRTSRLDGKTVLLVSGAIAGPVGLLEAAALVRSLGASQVHAAVLGGWPDEIQGCDSIEDLGIGSGPLDAESTRATRCVDTAA
jgi:hypothetical protein